MLGQATTNGSGQFSIRYTRGTSQSIFFVQAHVTEGVRFITILGPNLPTSVTINELTTVAATYSMAQFLRTGAISGNSFGLQLAAGMNDNIVTSATGESSPVLLNSPNAGPDEFTALDAIAGQFARGVRGRSGRHGELFRFDQAARPPPAT